MNLGFLDLEILFVDKDHLGYYAKAKIIHNGQSAVIRWGLDYITYRALCQVWTDFSSLKGVQVILKHWTVERQQVTLLCLLNNEIIHESRFRCSSRFLANLLWIAQIDNLGQLDGLLWEKLSYIPIRGKATDATPILPLKVSLRWKKILHSIIATATMVIVLGTLMLYYHSSKKPQDATADATAQMRQRNRTTNDTTVISSTFHTSRFHSDESRSSSNDSHRTVFNQNSTSVVTAVPEIWKVNRGDVALTIDDGPSPYTLSFIRILKDNHVHATFFFVGSQVDFWPSAVQAAFRAGDVVGDHTQTHPVLTNLSFDEQSWQIMTAVHEIQSVRQGPISLFRPPYGDFNQATKQILYQHHMTMVLWSSDPRDWAATSAEQIVKAVMDSHPSGKIIALNETPLTLKALPKIIELLKQQGLKLVVLTA